MLLEESPAEASRTSSFLNSIGLHDITSSTALGTTFFAIEEATIDMAELVGNVCSYFTYQGCTTDMKTDSCDHEDKAIYVVLTEIKQISPDQLEKVK